MWPFLSFASRIRRREPRRNRADADRYHNEFTVEPWQVEPLETRCMLAGDTFFTAEAIDVDPGEAATVSEAIDPANDVDIYAFQLQQGESATVELAVEGQGIVLGSQLRVFAPNGALLDELPSTGTTNPVISIQAPVAGIYFVGVSEVNVSYDPTVPGSALGGFSIADYDLHMTRLAGSGVIAGQVFHDANADGVRDPAEEGLNQVRIGLFDDTGGLIGSTITQDIDFNQDFQIDPVTERGWYTFAGLAPGDYTVGQVLTPGLSQTFPQGSQRLFGIPLDDGNAIVELQPRTGEEINRFTAPITVGDPNLFQLDGLAFDGESLFLISHSDPGNLYELDPDTGAVIDVDPLADASGPVGSGVYSGLGVVNGRVYAIDFGNSDLIEFDPETDLVTNVLPVDTLNPGFVLGTSLTGISDPNRLLATGVINGSAAATVEIDPTTGVATGSINFSGIGLAGSDTDIYAGTFDAVDPQLVVFSRPGALDRFVPLGQPIVALGGDDLGPTIDRNHVVSVAAGDPPLIRNFGNRIVPANLRGVQFRLFDETAISGSSISFQAVFENRSVVPSNATQFQVLLSADGVIDAADFIAGTFDLQPIPAGNTRLVVFEIAVPDGFSTEANLFAGLRTDPANIIVESNETDNANRGLYLDIAPLRIVPPTEIEGNGTVASANPIPRQGEIRGSIGSAGDVDNYVVTISQPGSDTVAGFLQQGRLTVEVEAAAGSLVDPVVSLFGPDMQLLATSNDVSTVDSGSEIVQYIFSLDAGSPETNFLVHEPRPFYIQISAADGSTGDYSLATAFEFSTPPFTTLNAGGQPSDVAQGDFNRDGITDFAVANSNNEFQAVFVYHGVGDGTYTLQQTLATGIRITTADLLVDDFNHDGRDDLAIANSSDAGLPGSDIGIFLGAEEGLFTELPFPVAAGGRVVDMVTGDFNSDGFRDIAALHNPPAGQTDGSMTLLFGDGTGGFTVADTVVTGTFPFTITGADLNQDGHDDLIVNNGGQFVPSNETLIPGDVVVYLGDGHGAFSASRLDFPGAEFQGPHPAGTAVADFNSDGLLDLAVTDGALNSPTEGRLFVVMALAEGGFAPPVEVATGIEPRQILAVDVNHDGAADLVNTNTNPNDVSVLLGDGNGNFTPAGRITAGANPNALTAGDYNRDGRLDLAIVTAAGLTTLQGLGNGEFLGFNITATGLRPESIATEDFNGDGAKDVAVANALSSDISILLGSGGLTLEEAGRFETGFGPTDIVAADFNRDGRIDLATANSGSDFFNRVEGGSISVLLGIGDGNFAEAIEFEIPPAPGSSTPLTAATTLTAIDFDRDGVLDIITNDFAGGDAVVFLGAGDGTFTLSERIPIAGFPADHLITDLNGDGLLDIAATDLVGQNGVPGAMTVHVGNPDGTFTLTANLPAGVTPSSIIAADFNGDAHLDLAVSHVGFTFEHGDDIPGNIFLYLGNGDGTYQQPSVITVDPVFGGPNIEAHLEDIRSGDFNGDGHTDLLVANVGDPTDGDNFGSITLLLGNGNGTFEVFQNLTDIAAVGAFTLGDFDNDGVTDVAAASIEFSFTAVLQGLPEAGFRFTFAASNSIGSAPQLADVNGDGREDALVISRDGEILIRLARDGAGQLDAPRLLNPGIPARSLTVVDGAAGTVIAAVDRDHDSVMLYQFTGGTASVIDTLSTGPIPTRIASADLDGNGLDDLAVVNLDDGTVDLFLAQADGSFQPHGAPLQAIDGAVDLELVDVDGNGTVDVLTANQTSGDVSVLLNDGSASFEQGGNFRAGRGPFGLRLDPSGGSSSASREASAALATGDFNGDGRLDTVVVNRETHTAGLLLGGEGGFVNVITLPIDAAPSQVVTNEFSGDGHLDMAILSADAEQLFVYLGDGAGNLSQGTTLPLEGNVPTGLTTLDVNRDGFQDLIVSNEFGDLLILPGDGDGTFEPFLRVDRTVSLALNDLDGDQQNDEVLLGNSSRDQVSLQEVSRLADELGFREVFEQDRENNLLAPGAVTILDIDGDGMRDLVVSNTGGNNLLIYLSDAAGNFSAGRSLSIFTGTNPTGITSEDFNGDGFADLVVANRGSNDVAVLFSQTDAAGQWTGLTPGPRLDTGSGPVSSEIIDRDGDGMLDLLVTNSLDGTMSVVPGVGGGFFDDANRLTVDLPGATNGFGTVFNGPLGFATLLDGSVAQFDATTLTSRVVAAGVGARSVAPFDFEGDGRLELIVAGADGSVSLFFDIGGDAFFADPNFVFTDPNLQSPSAVALAQLGDTFEIYVTDEGEEIVTVFQLEETVTDLKKYLADSPGGETAIENLLAVAIVQTDGDPEQLTERGLTTQFDGSGFDADQLSRIVREVAESVEHVAAELLQMGSAWLTHIRGNDAGQVVYVMADHAWQARRFAAQLLPGPAAEVALAVEYAWEAIGDATAEPNVDAEEDSFSDMLHEALAPWASWLRQILQNAPPQGDAKAPSPNDLEARSDAQTGSVLGTTSAPLPAPRPADRHAVGLETLAPGAVAALALARVARRKRRLEVANRT